MSTRAPRQGILFLGHHATRNGAPIELLHFLRWYKVNGSRGFSILLDEDGELAEEYGVLGSTWAADKSRWCPGGRRTQLLSAIGLGELARRAEKIDVRRFAAGCFPALFYINSVARGNARLMELLDPAVPMLTHVHELEFLLRLQAGPAASRVFARTRRFIACSNAVRENLIREHGIAPDRVETVHESIPVGQVRADRTRGEILRELELPDDALLVTSCGTAHWVKGTDLFVQLARSVCEKHSRAHFVWVGTVIPQDLAQLEHDVRRLGLLGRVRFVGLVPKPADYLLASDVFVLPSRVDSYPLVCLEAAAVGKPIVCFADAGGMPEFVEGDCGFVVPYLDVAAMAHRVVLLLDSPECRLTMGEAARRKVSERHDISKAAPQIMDIIERTIAGS